MIDGPLVEIIPKEAITEAGKLTREIGGFFGKVLGTQPQDFVGVMGGDWLHEIRERNLFRLKQRTEEILRKRNAGDNTEPLSPSEALPLFRAAADESRPELQELWARLLANTMDPQKPQITRVLIKVLQELDVLEARILQRLSNEDALEREIRFIDHAEHVNWRKDLAVSADQFTITVNRLAELQICRPHIVLNLQFKEPILSPNHGRRRIPLRPGTQNVVSVRAGP